MGGALSASLQENKYIHGKPRFFIWGPFGVRLLPENPRGVNELTGEGPFSTIVTNGYK